MAKAKSAARLYVEGLCRTLPDTPSKTLALRAIKEEPKLFNHLEHARSLVRTVRGNRGAHERKYAADKGSFRAPVRSGANWKAFLPKPVEREPWAPLHIDGPFKALVLSDIHVPFHDLEALTVAMELGRKDKCDLVLLNGDTMDFYAASRWQTDPRKRDFAGEIESGKQFLVALRRAFPKARIIWKYGNHDERYEKHMMEKAPEFLGVPDFELERLLRFEESRIESVKDCRPIFLGKLAALHGHEYKFAISNPVNAARGFYLRAKVHCIGGHLHRTSNHAEGDLNMHVTTTFSTGCLCDLKPDYARLNNWNQGFARVDVDKSGAFDVSNYRIVGGKVYR